MLAHPNERRLRACVLPLTYLFALPAICAVTAQPVPATEVSDDLQRTVSLDEPAERIVSLAPHLTELVHSAGAGDKLVGVSRHCDYPPSVSQLPAVSDHTTINYELLTKLQPDLVLVWGAGLKDTALRKLTSFHHHVYVSHPTDFGSIAENLSEIGTLTGTAAHARQAADAFLHKISGIASRHARPRPVRTLYLVWHSPPMTIGGGHWISRVIELCGGVNVFADTISDTVQLNRESLQLTPIDVVLHSLKSYTAPHRAAAFGKTLGLSAPIFYIEDNLIQRPSLRLAQGAASVCPVIHTEVQ